MDMLSSGNAALGAVFVMLVTVLVQGMIAAGLKASRPGAIPGKLNTALSHESLVFRAHRTFMNSLENLPWMLATVVLAMLTGVNPYWTALLAWIYALARIVHMVLYYAIATEKNPSPRSYFFLIGLLANWVLLIFAGITLV